MVLQPLTNRQIGDHLDAEQRQRLGRSDTGQHEQFRRLVGAGGQDHLTIGDDGLDLPAPIDLYTGRPGAVENDPLRGRLGKDGEVGPGQRGVQVCHGSAAAHTVSLRQLVEADAVLLGAVEVVVPRVTGLHRCLDER